MITINSYSKLMILLLFMPLLLGCESIFETYDKMTYENLDLSCEEWLNFTSEQYDFSIDYPKNWNSFDLPFGNHGDKEEIAFFLTKQSLDVPNLTILYNGALPPTLDDVVQWGKRRILAKFSSSDVEIGELSEIIIKDQEYPSRNYEIKNINLPGVKPDTSLVIVQVYFLREKDALILQFAATKDQLNEFSPCLEHMVSSFRTEGGR